MRKDKVLRYLEDEEPDYTGAAESLGAEALPHLETVVRGRDPLLAAKATHLASLIGTPGARKVVEAAAEHPDATVRVAAAAALGTLVSHQAMEAPYVAEPGGLLDRLLEDGDAGVRQFAITTALGMDLRDRVERVAESDPKDFLREFAAASLRGH